MFVLFFRFVLFFIIFLNNKPSFSNIQSNNSATKINSDIVLIKRQSSIIEFSGNAVIENGDTSILADKVIVFYEEEKSKDRSGFLKEAQATGKVKIFNEEFFATGDKGVYNPSKKSFILTGDEVIFNNGTSVAKGSKFVYNLESRKGVLVGENMNHENGKVLKGKKQRVTVILNESI